MEKEYQMQHLSFNFMNGLIFNLVFLTMTFLSFAAEGSDVWSVLSCEGTDGNSSVVIEFNETNKLVRIANNPSRTVSGDFKNYVITWDEKLNTSEFKSTLDRLSGRLKVYSVGYGVFNYSCSVQKKKF